MNHLIGILAVALTGYFTARVVRTLGFVQPWLVRGVKPWACNVCMGWWGAVLAASVAYLVLSGGLEAFLTWRPYSFNQALVMYWGEGQRWFLYTPPAAGIAVTLLDHYAGLPHELPDLPDDMVV